MVDFTAWDTLLSTYVEAGQVDYARWKAESVTTLDQWLAEVSNTHTDELDQPSATAFFINLYNALAIRQVLKKYPIESIRPMLLGVPNMASFLLFFKQEIYTLHNAKNGAQLSLDGIEHGILRKQYSDPRMHFALVCVSQGCPRLRASAYTPHRLDAQLEEDAHRFINNPNKVKYEQSNNTLYCSKIFKWYEKDFIGQSSRQSNSVASYIQLYLPEENIPSEVSIEYLPYSWQLNQRISS
ncbi:MAG: DUF547 domain-containing protein [Cyanobacteria bacterium J06560_2]